MPGGVKSTGTMPKMDGTVVTWRSEARYECSGGHPSRVGGFVRTRLDGNAIAQWYRNLTAGRGLSVGTAVRHFNVMHHMMEKAATIWNKETGIDRNPADQVEVKRPDDQRERYLSADEILRFKRAVDEKKYRKGGKGINETFSRLRLIILIALTTGMRIAEIFGLNWADVLYAEGLIAVRAKLKGGKAR